MTKLTAPTKLPAAERLRDPEIAQDPDERTTMFWGQNPPSLVSHHADIAKIQLDPSVPEAIAIQFETTRNLYLYAWHVYRFYMVAQMHSLATLELALKQRLPDKLPQPYQRPKQKRAMLAGLLGYAIDQGLIRNEGFRRWHIAAEHHAKQRREWAAVKTMIDQQLASMQTDDDEPLVITPDDQRWDLVGVLRESLPQTRNDLAHGSTALTRQVLGDIELVAEIINQLYAESIEQINASISAAKTKLIT